MNNARPSPWSLTIAKVAGIPIRLHFTLILFLAYLAFAGIQKEALGAVGLAIAVFASVLLHELGHALTAKHFGVSTRDITLYPIGGVAVLEGKKPRAREELWIALAGPLVNVVIAVALTPLVLAGPGLPPVGAGLESNSALQAIWSANLFLALFNMLPAFPMDGGRVLRAILALKMPDARATQIAGGIGQMMAILIGLYAILSGQAILMLVAFFVFLGAAQEVASTVQSGYLAGRHVGEAMITDFQTLSNGSTLEDASRLLISGSQQDFPVVFGEEVLGVLNRTALAQGIAAQGPAAYVATVMSRDTRRLAPGEPLERAIEMFSSDRSSILVMKAESLVGILTAENLSEFIMLEHARASRARS